MIDRQHEAIKRLISKQDLKGFGGAQLLEYIMSKLLDSDNKRGKRLWLKEFNKNFDALPVGEQEILAYGSST